MFFCCLNPGQQTVIISAMLQDARSLVMDQKIKVYIRINSKRIEITLYVYVNEFFSPSKCLHTCRCDNLCQRASLRRLSRRLSLPGRVHNELFLLRPAKAARSKIYVGSIILASLPCIQTMGWLKATLPKVTMELQNMIRKCILPHRLDQMCVNMLQMLKVSLEMTAPYLRKPFHVEMQKSKS